MVIFAPFGSSDARAERPYIRTRFARSDARAVRPYYKITKAPQTSTNSASANHIKNKLPSHMGGEVAVLYMIFRSIYLVIRGFFCIFAL